MTNDRDERFTWWDLLFAIAVAALIIFLTW